LFKEERKELMFDWQMIGDLADGRPNLGSSMDVSVYRLMQFTLRDVLIKEFDTQTADRIFYDAGEHSGKVFCKELMNTENNFNDFIAELQDKLKGLKVGILRVEKADIDTLNLTLTLAEDLDCSGLPFSDEEVCTYDEGFFSGVLSVYTGKNFDVKEVDCWCAGDRVCRFEVKPKH